MFSDTIFQFYKIINFPISSREQKTNNSLNKHKDWLHTLKDLHLCKCLKQSLCTDSSKAAGVAAALQHFAVYL